MLEFHLVRDREDAERCASGLQRGRVGLYASAIARLRSGEDVYESYQVLKAAGIELSEEATRRVSALPRAWQRICRMDADGRLWTASMQEKTTLR